MRHTVWRQKVDKLFGLFGVVAFDNLALEQLQVRRFVSDQQWASAYQGEHSFYVDAVNRCFAPSSRSLERVPWDSVTFDAYFQQLESMRGV